ncbi:MAG: helix-turn-helix transcriptional regulator, partial [Oscillospiraceae bacterium]|nr:helix-turn-helix transcriptional regulator [Oscillospiraceae bacterium]
TGMSALLVTFLEENYKNKLSLKTLSQRFLISEGHVNRLVRNEVHMGAITYIRHLRMEEAARRLTTTDLPVHEISEYVGYTDTNYFCRVFKSIYGITPSEYRTNRT